MAKKSSSQTIVHKMDAFAVELIDKAKTAEGLADRIAAFSAAAKWIAIKNKIEDPDEGASINDLKSKLKGNNAGGKGNPFFRDSARQRELIARRWGNASPAATAGDGGETLNALKAKLPTVGNGPDDRSLRIARDGNRNPAFAAHQHERVTSSRVLGGYQPIDTGDSGGDPV